MTTRRHRIALLADNFFGEYQTVIRHAVESATREHDIDLLTIIGRELDGPAPYQRFQNQIYNDIARCSATGIVLMSSTLSNYCGVDKLSQFCQQFLPIPMCSLGIALKDIPSVVIENVGFGETALHLVNDHGCRKFAFIGGPAANQEAHVRRESFLAALDSMQIPFDKDLEVSGNFLSQSGYEAVLELSNRGKIFDALIAANDAMALGAIAGLRENGIRVPEDVRVVGFDDIPEARFSEPTLSTIQQPLEEISHLAVECVLGQIEGAQVPNLKKIQPVPIHRASCGCDRKRSVSSFPGAPVAPSKLSKEQGKAELAELLQSNVYIPKETHADWVNVLVTGFFDEIDAKQGSFISALERILNLIRDRPWLMGELQSAISLIRRYCKDEAIRATINLDSLWHRSQQVVFDALARSHMDTRRAITLTNILLLRRAEEEHGSPLSRDILLATITAELQTMGIDNATVSLFTSPLNDELNCVIAIRNGKPITAELLPYPVATLVPPFLEQNTRTSYVAFPLSSNHERFGVLILELGATELYYEILRDYLSTRFRHIDVHQTQVERLEAESKQRQKEQQLQHRQKLESLGVLAGGIAHDFNNMLSALAGNLDIISMDSKKTGVNAAPVEECQQVVKHAAGLCNQLLAYSGKGKFVTRRLNLNLSLIALKDFIKLAVSAGVKVTFDLQEGLPDIEGDGNQINQVFINLLINASEAMGKKGGVINVQTTTQHYDEGTLKSPVSQEALPFGEYVIVRIRDTGEGISQENIQRIFDPFFSTKFAGRGLGLAAVLGIVRGHQGAIQLESEKGKGTCFELIFPKMESEREVTPQVTSRANWKGHGTILFVDDEVQVMRAGTRLLQRMGFSTLTARNGVEALEILENTTTQITCILLDITMPQMGGIETMREVKKRYPRIPVILMSGYSQEQAIGADTPCAPAAFIHKPYDYKSLSTMLQQVLDPPVK